MTQLRSIPLTTERTWLSPFNSLSSSIGFGSHFVPLDMTSFSQTQELHSCFVFFPKDTPHNRGSHDCWSFDSSCGHAEMLFLRKDSNISTFGEHYNIICDLLTEPL